MSEARVFNGAPTISGLSASSVTLVEGTSFAISSASGDIEPGGAQGLFFEDTRFVSCWRLCVDGTEVQNLGVIQSDPFAATFVSRGRPCADRSDSTLVVIRKRFVGDGMREDLVIRNLDREPAGCTLSIELAADFAHIFDVKEDRVHPVGEHSVELTPSAMLFNYKHHDVTRRLEVAFPPAAVVRAGLITMDIVVPARSETTTCFEFRLEVDGEKVDPRHRCGEPVESSTPATRLRSWEQNAPRVHTGRDGLDTTLQQSTRDLGALRIFNPEDPGLTVIAAGAPWFMTLFGRDSLITGLMALGVDPSLATGTLLTLAGFQGERVDPLTEEEPGKILHELRRGLTTVADAKEGSIYYGSIDATPLFVIVLAELYRWGLDDALVRRLLPHADRALSWIDEYGDRDGDGFVEYQRSTGRGLANQGWKDSFDGVNFANGRLAEPPIALCEVQGYVYAAFLARAELARGLGDGETAATYSARASRLKLAFNERFWIDARGYYAIGLDGDKRPIDALTSNIGHCLWTGIIDEARAATVARRLLGPEMFTGWGIRTLASTMGVYNPVSYHNGSVWPHDSAICAAGLMRYGFVEESHAVTLGLLQAATSFGGRLPELLCGFDRSDFPVPVRYPTSCAPQAWSSATPFWLLRTTLLRLDPSLPEHEVKLAPCVPAELGSLSIENFPLAGSRLSIEASGSSAVVGGLPPDLNLIGAAVLPSS